MNKISIVTFKWSKPKTGYRLKSPVEYSHEHVNVVYNSIKRNTTLPFDFFCVTDNPSGLHSDIKFVPLWDKYISLGGCYNRLYVFSDEVEILFGKRFLCIDLDCVIVSNIDHILKRSDDFVINKFISKGGHGQIYNGGLFMMTTGSRKQVWKEFIPQETLPLLDQMRAEKNLVGSDQAWIQTCLGDNEALFTEQDGIYDYSFLPNNLLPDNASIVFFPGKVDPSQEKEKVKWVNHHWK